MLKLTCIICIWLANRIGPITQIVIHVSVDIAEMAPYDYIQSSNVVVTITSGKENIFRPTAKHNGSNIKFTIDESGDVNVS